MSKYAGTAEKIAKSVANAIREMNAEDASVTQTANNMVADLQEFAADMNVALKKEVPTLKAEVTASPWKKDGNVVSATLSVSRNGQKHNIEIAFQFGSDTVNVNGKPVAPGEGPMNRIGGEVQRILKA